MGRNKIIRINCHDYDSREWTRGEIIIAELLETYGSGRKLGDVSISNYGKFIDDGLKIIDRQLRRIRRKPQKLDRCQYSGCTRRNKSVQPFNSYEEGTVYMCAAHRLMNEGRTGYTVMKGENIA